MEPVYASADPEFQFQTGSIKRETAEASGVITDMFQFQTGSIKS